MLILAVADAAAGCCCHCCCQLPQLLLPLHPSCRRSPGLRGGPSELLACTILTNVLKAGLLACPPTHLQPACRPAQRLPNTRLAGHCCGGHHMAAPPRRSLCAPSGGASHCSATAGARPAPSCCRLRLTPLAAALLPQAGAAPLLWPAPPALGPLPAAAELLLAARSGC
jgi:hypothetical protein